MAKHFISKGKLDEEGLREIVVTILDQGDQARDEILERIADASADARIDALVNGGNFLRWPHAQQHPQKR